MGRPKNASGDTKLRIMNAAMQLFADKGFEHTTTRDIATSVGIKDASLYNHFCSKQEIFDAAIEAYTNALSKRLRETGAMASPEDSAEPYVTSDTAAITQVVLASLQPLFEDADAILLRRVLESNRHTNACCKRLYQETFVERPLAIQESIFKELVNRGSFSPCDTHLSALEFYGLPYLLLTQGTPWKDAKPLIECHIASFNAEHRPEKRE